MRRRSRLLVLIGVGVIVFLAVSLLLARVFAADGSEQSAITDLVQAEARGDARAMEMRILGCPHSAACQQAVAQDAVALKRPGTVSILQLQPSTSFSLTATLGTARVAWKVPSSLPIVQCVRVRRAGDAISGLRVELLAITSRLPSDAGCPARF